MATEQTLFGGNGHKDDLSYEGVRVVDPTEGIDETLNLTVEAGVITKIEPGSGGDGRIVAPGFVDPHVHLRTPGREDEEDIASGTKAAAAGGYCAILAMPNTEPAVDSAAVLGALVERAKDEAEIPVGFFAAISKGQDGAELTEMVELAERGAAGFTDDGRPVASPGLLRRALQYHAVTGRRIAVHCEEAALSRGGHVHEGLVSAELGFGGYPSVAESVMVGRDLMLAAYENQPIHVLHLSARESVDELRSARSAGVQASGEVTPHHLCLTDEAVRSLDPNLKMNPPLRAEEDRQALLDGLKDGAIEAIATDHAPHARHEKDVPFEEAPFGVTGLETSFSVLYTRLVEPGTLSLAALIDRMSAGPARIYGWSGRGSRGRARQPRRPRPRADVARRERLPVALAQLLALGRTLRGKVVETVMNGSWRTRMSGSSPRSVFHGFRRRPRRRLRSVFTTAMTSYREIVTDPSYAEQLVCFTPWWNYGSAPARRARGCSARPRGQEWSAGCPRASSRSRRSTHAPSSSACGSAEPCARRPWRAAPPSRRCSPRCG
jgi:dihydroorotase